MQTDHGLICRIGGCDVCGAAILASLREPDPLYCDGCRPHRPMNAVDRIVEHGNRGKLRAIGRG